MANMFPTGTYSTILADPPWHFHAWSEETGSGRNASQHYDTMTQKEICSLPVEKLAASDCALFLWATWPCLFRAQEVIEAWGFTYKTLGFIWVKTNQSNAGLAYGMGYWTRSNTEPLLLATKGSPNRVSASVHEVIVEPRREHSRKPDEVYERIEALVEGPYVELFARQERPGWTTWGNEVDKFCPQPRQVSLFSQR